jgi:hypothetical protein
MPADEGRQRLLQVLPVPFHFHVHLQELLSVFGFCFEVDG